MHTPSSTNVDTPLDSPSPIEIYDVVVVGAGPVGLATAIGLHQRGIQNILVIDQTRAFRQVGQVIDLLPNGLKALKYINLTAYEEVIKKSINFSKQMPPEPENISETRQEQKPSKASHKWTQKNLKGQTIRSFSLNYEDWFKEYGEGRVSIAWYDLQATLRHQLPQDRVKPNHRCIDVVNEPELGCVRIDCVSDLGVEVNPYAHWTDRQTQEDATSSNVEAISQQLAKTSIRAKLVVAADGINSTVRRVLYADSPYQA
ncbi:MAG TPA: FAD-dependent monooxygenase, partial [Allocoleopsis sp.]